MTPALSPSQINTGLECLRKFGFKYLTDLPKPEPGPGAVRGQIIHDIAEAYLDKAVAPDRDVPEGAIFIEGLPYLPGPGTGGVVQFILIRPTTSWQR